MSASRIWLAVRATGSAAAGSPAALYDARLSKLSLASKAAFSASSVAMSASIIWLAVRATLEAGGSVGCSAASCSINSCSIDSVGAGGGGGAASKDSPQESAIVDGRTSSSEDDGRTSSSEEELTVSIQPALMSVSRDRVAPRDRRVTTLPKVRCSPDTAARPRRSRRPPPQFLFLSRCIGSAACASPTPLSLPCSLRSRLPQHNNRIWAVLLLASRSSGRRCRRATSACGMQCVFCDFLSLTCVLVRVCCSNRLFNSTFTQPRTGLLVGALFFFFASTSLMTSPRRGVTYEVPGGGHH